MHIHSDRSSVRLQSTYWCVSFHPILLQTAHVINETLNDLFPREEGVDVIAEPGRYVVASAYTAIVNMIGKRVIPKKLYHEENGIMILFWNYFDNSSIATYSFYFFFWYNIFFGHFYRLSDSRFVRVVL